MRNIPHISTRPDQLPNIQKVSRYEFFTSGSFLLFLLHAILFSLALTLLLTSSLILRILSCNFFLSLGTIHSSNPVVVWAVLCCTRTPSTSETVRIFARCTWWLFNSGYSKPHITHNHSLTVSSFGPLHYPNQTFLCYFSNNLLFIAICFDVRQ